MIEVLVKKLGETVRENEPLSKHTNFRIGGPARYFFEATSSEVLVQAVRAALELGLAYFVLGGGSNVLVSDRGFDGLVLKVANRKFEIKSETAEVITEAGVLTAFLARKTAEAGLTGLEWAVSLPGTIGGSIRGNAGCFGGEMRQVITQVAVLALENNQWLVANYANKDCQFEYRDSIFKHLSPPPIILSAEFQLKKDDSAACLARLEETLAKRKQSQPFESSSAGCMFKNFEFDKESEVAKIKKMIDIPEEFMKAKRIPAGWIVEQLNLKGKQIGDAKVSEKHGNFLVNVGNATADNVIQLVSLIKMKARDEFGIELHEEVQYMGF